jgi:hypothetical protein
MAARHRKRIEKREPGCVLRKNFPVGITEDAVCVIHLKKGHSNAKTQSSQRMSESYHKNERHQNGENVSEYLPLRSSAFFASLRLIVVSGLILMFLQGG